MKILIIVLSVSFILINLGCNGIPKENPTEYKVEEFDYQNYSKYGKLWFKSPDKELLIYIELGEQRIQIDEVGTYWFLTERMNFHLDGNQVVLTDWVDNKKHTVEEYDIRFINAGTIELDTTITWYMGLGNYDETEVHHYDKTVYLVDKNDEQ